MADDIDVATSLIEGELEMALKRIRQNSQDNKGSKICVECGDNVPEARQKLGFKLCLPCAEETERRKSLFADY